MKAWRREAAAINARKAAGSKEPSAHVQMQQRRHINRTFKPKGSGNWLLDDLLIHAGFKAAVYGTATPKQGMPINVEDVVPRHPLPSDGGKSLFGKLMGKAKRWWNS